ncbi:HEPN domain-containing protein [Candidatus Woesearchaeota archaeon]|nr:HEPN domain-containing protein [Candidatus Woesearchaeota archaeon]
MVFNKDEYKEEFNKQLKARAIKPSSQGFKIKLFLQKAENSLLIAKHTKEIKPTEDQPKKLYWDYWAITISYYSMLYAAKAAILSKGFEVNDHDAAQIALGHLLVPDEIEKEDLELLSQSYKIFEDEYVKYFEDAKTESYIARYSAIRTYTQRRLEEIFSNATKFIAKISLILQE